MEQNTTTPTEEKVQDAAAWVPSLLPQATAATLDEVMAQVGDEPDPEKQKEIIQERLNRFMRENYVIYYALSQSFPPPVVGAVAFTYAVLAAQAKKDARWPS